MESQICIIGAGGVGSWLTPSLALLTSPDRLVLIDGDKLEEKNMDRQLFSSEDIGSFKADALAKRYRVQAMSKWYYEGLIRHSSADWVMACVDNNPARIAALNACDRYGCKAIIAANETHSAEAYYYCPDWKDGPLDPRVYYPELLKDKTGDPRRATIGCTGEAQQQNPQLVTSNMLAAGLAGHLFALWALKAPESKPETREFLSYKFVANMNKLESLRVCDTLKKQ